MKAILTIGALLAAATAVFGQGQFLFNTHNSTVGNDVSFWWGGTPISDPDWFVQVFAGPDEHDLQPVTGTLGGPLPLNRPIGKGAGYTNPFSDIYTIPGMRAGQSAVVGYQAFQGNSRDTATVTFPLGLAISPITLTEPPTPPNEVLLGTQVWALVPEPSTAALGLLGCTAALLARGRRFDSGVKLSDSGLG